MNIHCIEIFSVQHFWTTCTCPKKQSFPWKFSLYWLYTFYHSGFLSNLCCPEVFHLIEYTFYIQDFWATCACAEKQSCPEIFHCFEIVLLFRNFEQLALVLKTEFALKFFTGLKHFLSFRILSNLALALKTEFALKIFKPGAGSLHPPRTPMV